MILLAIVLAEAERVHRHFDIWPIVAGAGGQYVFSAFVTSMPAYQGQNYWVKWLYAFLHLIAANLDKVHIPGSAADLAAMPAPPAAAPAPAPQASANPPSAPPAAGGS